MTAVDVEQQAVGTIREVAAIAAQHADRESPGACMLAILITAYSLSVAEYLREGVISLEQALVATQKDFDVVHDSLREVAARKDPP